MNKMDKIPFIAGGIFFSVMLFGIITEANDTSSNIQRTSRTLSSTIKENPNHQSINYKPGPDDDPEDPEGEYDNNPNFDESQYASQYWSDFFEDPENIDDYPENIFDASLY